MSGPAPKPTPAELAECLDVLMDLCDHATEDELPTLREAIAVVQRHQDGGDPT